MNQGSRVISFWNSEAPRRHRRPPHFLAALTQCPPLAHYHSLSLDQRLVSRDSSLCSPERGPSGQPSSRQVPWGSFTSASRAQRPRGPSSLLGSPSCPARDSRSCPPTHSLTCRGPCTPHCPRRTSRSPSPRSSPRSSRSTSRRSSRPRSTSRPRSRRTSPRTSTSTTSPSRRRRSCPWRNPSSGLTSRRRSLRPAAAGCSAPSARACGITQLLRMCPNGPCSSCSRLPQGTVICGSCPSHRRTSWR